MNAEHFLLDVNILVALFDPQHSHHRIVARWFSSPGLQWGTCAFTEAGFLRITTSTPAGRRTLEQATKVVKSFSNDPNFAHWPMRTSWTSLVAPFAGRLYGHQQITDAYLLGLAIKENGVLVTLDKAMNHLAGPRYSKHVLVLE
ncbi:MAG: TA system VapC family ribonuclease toxin [Terracidiphilus sp.]|jgi:toxin-antitoxin system PIN domain toxin